MDNKKTPMMLFNDTVDILNLLKKCEADFIEQCNIVRSNLALVDTKSGEQYFVMVFKNYKCCKIEYPSPNPKPLKDFKDMSEEEHNAYLLRMLGFKK